MFVLPFDWPERLHRRFSLTFWRTHWFALWHSFPEHSTTQERSFSVQMIDATLTSSLYSRKTRKLLSWRRIGWAANRWRKTSCMDTVFLNIAKYSLESREREKWSVKEKHCRHSRFQFLFHLFVFFSRQWTFAITQLLQFRTRGIEIRSGRWGWNLSNDTWSFDGIVLV